MRNCIILILSLALMACSDESEGPDGAAGGAGSGGSGGAAGQKAASTTPTEGEPCDTAGELACPGKASDPPAGYSLRCVAGKWALNENCDSGEGCNAKEGPNRGRCMAPFKACVGKTSTDKVCDNRAMNDYHVMQCDNPFEPTEVERCLCPCMVGPSICSPLGKSGGCN